MGRALAPLLRAAAMLSLLAAAGFAWAGAPGQGARLYDMWLRYEPLPPSRQRDLRPAMRRVACANTTADSPLATACAELSRGLSSMLQAPVPVVNASGPLAAGTLTVVTESDGDAEFRVMRYGGTVEDERARLLWAGATGALQLHGATGRAALFAAFRVLADLQLGRLAVPAGRAPGGAGVTVLRSYAPSTSLRFWNLWDNLDGVTAYQKNCDDFDRIPRSALHWDDLPNLRPRYTDMARLLSSVGVNSIVLNNVNACDEENVALMSSRYIGKAAALAKVMARHGIAAYLCPCFGSPVFVGNLTTADPVNPLVVRWWHDKVQELRRAFSGSFGGFLIKADSEGEMGPSVYNRTLVQGANMLAAALVGSDALLVWRSFMHPGEWGNVTARDRDQAVFLYDTFVKYDGQWADNVVLQTKTGPFDFQVHEPVQSLFGALKHTNLIMEVEVSQTFTGQARHLCFLPSQWASYLRFDTGKDGPDWPLGRVLRAPACRYCGMAGVGNLFEAGTPEDPAWTVSVFGQANTFGFGRLAWNTSAGDDEIAGEWSKLTFQAPPPAHRAITGMLVTSWGAFENYTSPLGLGYIVDATSHYWMDPDGWRGTGKPPDNGYGGGFNATRFRIGYSRSTTYGQTYSPPYSHALADPATTPRRLLLTFHNLGYTDPLPLPPPLSGAFAEQATGRTVLQAFYEAQSHGLASAGSFIDTWAGLSDYLDPERHAMVAQQLQRGLTDAHNFTATMRTWLTNVSGVPPTHSNSPVLAD